MKQSFSASVPLVLSFLIFSMLLNCMGIVILQLSREHVSYSGLGFLEFFKDVPIAIVSIFAVDFLKKLSSRKTLLIAHIFVALACVLLPFFNIFWFFKIWFAIVGICFAITKISVFSLLKYQYGNSKSFAEKMSRVEASFMIGIFLINIFFSFILSGNYATFWKFGFWVIALLAIFNSILILRLNISEVDNEEEAKLKLNLSEIFHKESILFFAIIFLITFVEQSFSSWLPTFYHKYLYSSAFVALQFTALLALFSFFGRMLTSKIISKKSWYFIALTCIFSVFALLILAYVSRIVIPNNLYISMVLFTGIGFFISPLYPVINSRFLGNISNKNTGKTVSFIVVFSALGSSIGSLLTSIFFQYGIGNYYAIYLCFPIILIFLLIISLLKNKNILNNI